MRIGEVSKRTGCKVETIRFYEQEGLMPPPDRSLSGYRLYRESDVERLGFISRSRGLGFTLPEVRQFIALEEDAGLSCGDVDRIARERHAQVQEKLAQLQRLERELASIVHGCKGGKRAKCEILGVLHGREAPNN